MAKDDSDRLVLKMNGGHITIPKVNVSGIQMYLVFG
jgi:hypothetical protein